MKIGEKIYKLIEVGAKTGVGFLPGPISAAFNAVYDNAKSGVLNARAEKWKSDVVSRLEKLEAEYDAVVNNESFATALIKTSELAIKTESDEKRQILADALINTYSQNISEDKTLIFLQLIEKYTVLHIQIIKYLHDEYLDERFFNNQAPTFMVLFRLKFNGVEDVYLKKMVKDLQNDYLVEEFRDDAKVEFWRHRFELLTQLGKDFYDYLKPAEEEKNL